MRKPLTVSKPAPSWLFPTLLALTALLLVGLFSTEISDPDFWWHLKTGEYIVTQHRLPSTDPFAYTTATAPSVNPDEPATRRFNLTHEWLAQALWYAVYRAGGFGGVVLWKALLLAFLCGCTGWVAQRRSGSWLWGGLAALAVASLAIEFAHDRPGIISYVFVAVFVLIWEDRRRLWLLPLLSAIWANCHGGFFLGWVVCGAYGAEALVKKSQDWRKALLYGGLAVALSGFNPNGFAAVTTVLRYRQSPLQSTLLEWAPVSVFGWDAFHLLLYGAVIAMLLSWKRVRLADWLLFGAFAVAALTAFRNELLIGLLAPVMIASYLKWKPVPPVAAQYVAAGLLLVTLAVGCAKGWFYQLRAAEWRFPVGAASFLAEHHFDGRIFNTYESGGYLIWRGQQVFIDGRALSEAVFQDYRILLAAPPNDPARSALFDKYGIGVVVLNAFEYNAGTLYPVTLSMSGWNLVFEDTQSLVFVRNPPAGTSVLDAARLKDHLDAECRLHMQHDPDLPGCARASADYFMRTNDKPRARRALELYLTHPYPGDTEAQRAYLQLR